MVVVVVGVVQSKAWAAFWAAGVGARRVRRDAGQRQRLGGQLGEDCKDCTATATATL